MADPDPTVRLDVDGATVAAGTGGHPVGHDRPLVVLLHGAGMDRTVWSHVTPALAAAGYRVLAVDLPGHGASEGPARTSVVDLADWIAGVVDVAAAGPAHLVGHSLGSFAALDAAARHPDAVATLTLVGTAATMRVNPDLLVAADADDPQAAELIARWNRPRGGEDGRHPGADLTFVETEFRMLSGCGPGVLAGDLRACGAYEGAVAAAANVSCPVLVVLGESDRMAPAAGAEPLLAALSAPRSVIIDGAGHMPMVERPGMVTETLLGFFAVGGGSTGRRSGADG
jgi:pimeloyl-ACP methyl ester carboxylesterase